MAKISHDVVIKAKILTGRILMSLSSQVQVPKSCQCCYEREVAVISDTAYLKEFSSLANGAFMLGLWHSHVCVCARVYTHVCACVRSPSHGRKSGRILVILLPSFFPPFCMEIFWLFRCKQKGEMNLWRLGEKHGLSQPVFVWKFTKKKKDA